MRARALAPAAIAGALALALAPALPAAAATTSWTQPGDSWWSTATWSPAVPAAGNDVTFAGGPRSTYNLGNVTFGSFSFPTTHTIANGGGAIGLSGGIDVGNASTARIETDISVVGTQTWYVEPGSTLQIPTWITTDGTGTLHLDVEGTLELSGNLDALGTGGVDQRGGGLVVRAGGAGGGIGGGGYNVIDGEFRLDGASIGGTDVQVTGGLLTGDGVFGALALADGVLSPGGATPIGLIGAERAATLSGGVYLVDVDPATGDSDYVITRGVLSGTGAALVPMTASTPEVGDAFEIIGAWREGSVDPGFRFRSPAGAVIEDGDPFVSGGGLWTVHYIAGAGGVVALEYLGAAPAAPAPLPATGQETGWLLPLGIVAGVLVLAGIVFLIVRAVRARRSPDA